MKHVLPTFFLLAFTGSCIVLNSCRLAPSGNKVHLDLSDKPDLKFSAYCFFKGANDFTKPNPGVMRYRYVNTMFNDFSQREDFIYVPPGKCFDFDSMNILNLPVGSCLINIVYYQKDERATAIQKQFIESQLLVRNATGWEARDYIWNEEQTDAELNIAGDIEPVRWIAKNGQERQVDFVIPSKNECKSCHWYADHIAPIGVSAPNLNLDVEYATGLKNQLQYWVSNGLLKNFSVSDAAKYPDWRDTTVAIDQRVRTYLNTNCAHCHNPKGPGYVSGLFLDWDNNSAALNGVCKSPPSAGKGSCNLKYDMVPGKPGESIIVCRMAATELGVKMPQLGRTIIDNEGVALIIQWIAQLKGDCSVKR